MKAILYNKKVFQHDIVALALACITVSTPTKKVGLVSRSGCKSFEQHPNYILPVGWSTSISIAQRKLII